jgi:hypothetical protein
MMKKNIKYVKDVLDKLNKDKVITRDKLFYSIGIICVLFMFVKRFDNLIESKKVEKLPTIEQVKEIKTNKWDTMSFKEKFRLSRDFHGPNGLFMWNGKTYHCKYVEEMIEEVNICK